MIWLGRRLPALQSAAINGRWARGDLPSLTPMGLCGATVAVIGLGVIGKQMATILATMGCRVLGVDPYVSLDSVEMTDVDTALREADVVTLHCSLNDGNRGFIDHAKLASMKRGALLINTARGPLLDVEEAAAAVKRGHLAGLAVDVFPVEPYPLLADLSHPQILLSPHASGYTQDLAERVSREVHETLTCWVNGNPLPNLVR